MFDMKDVLISERTFFSIGLLIPIGLVVGAWIDLSGDSRVHASQIATLQQQQVKSDEKFDKIMDSLSDMKADLKSIQNRLVK
jgi:hypothetical protein